MFNAQLKRLESLVARASARSSGAPSVAGANLINFADNVTLGPLNGTTTVSTVLAAFDLTPQRGGVYFVSVTVNFVLSAADTVAFTLDSVPAVTAISGGAAIRSTFHYETTGSPLVVTGGTPVIQQTVTDEVATGQISAQSVTISGFVQLLPTPTRQAIMLTVQTIGGAHLTTIGIPNAAAIEQ